VLQRPFSSELDEVATRRSCIPADALSLQALQIPLASLLVVEALALSWATSSLHRQEEVVGVSNSRHDDGLTVPWRPWWCMHIQPPLEKEHTSLSGDLGGAKGCIRLGERRFPTKPSAIAHAPACAEDG